MRKSFYKLESVGVALGALSTVIVCLAFLVYLDGLKWVKLKQRCYNMCTIFP